MYWFLNATIGVQIGACKLVKSSPVNPPALYILVHLICSLFYLSKAYTVYHTNQEIELARIK